MNKTEPEHTVYKFANGYGASVVRHPHSYGGREGLRELAVIQHDDGRYWEPERGWDICYSTPITNDVIGWMKDDDVVRVLQQIRRLPPRVGWVQRHKITNDLHTD